MPIDRNYANYGAIIKTPLPTPNAPSIPASSTKKSSAPSTPRFFSSRRASQTQAVLGECSQKSLPTGAGAVVRGILGMMKVLWKRSGDIFTRARHLPAQSSSVYKIREGFAKADNEAIVKIAPLLFHKKRIAAQGSLLFFLFSLFLQGDNARAPLATITTWTIRKKASNDVILPAPCE